MSFSVSIIVCTYNGSSRISNCISSLINQEFAPEFEIIIVDNGSTDRTDELAERQLSILFPKGNWKIIKETIPGLIYARVTGIKAARFEYILFCDDDNVLYPNFLSVAADIFKANEKIGVLGGVGIPNLDAPKPNWFATYQKSFACGPQSKDSGEIKDPLGYVYGASSFFLKKPLLFLIDSGYKFHLTGRIKGKAISGDDLELCWLIKLMGNEIYYSENLKFTHLISTSRITTEYLIKMKSGTSAGSALLFAYQHFIKKNRTNYFLFIFSYFTELFKSGFFYFKNRFFGVKNLTSWENDLAMAILKARWDSFRTNFSKSFSIYSQLKSRNEFWVSNL